MLVPRTTGWKAIASVYVAAVSAEQLGAAQCWLGVCSGRLAVLASGKGPNFRLLN